MKVFLYILAAIFFIAPLAFWAFLSAMKCAYVTSFAQSCGVELSDFLDAELLPYLVPAWLVGLVLFLLARRKGISDETGKLD